MGGVQLTLTEASQRASGQKLKLTGALELFEQVYVPMRKLTELTQKEYRLDLNQLTRFLKTASIVYIQDVKQSDLQKYLDGVKQKGIGPAAQQRKTSSIKSLFGFLSSNDFIPDNPAARLLLPQVPRGKTYSLTSKEIAALKKAASGNIRDAAIIEILVQTGMRVSELLRVNVQDVVLPPSISEHNRGAVAIRRKGETVHIPIDQRAIRLLYLWLGVRPKTQYQKLFLSRHRLPLNPRTFQLAIKEYGKKAGIPDLSPRTLQSGYMLPTWHSEVPRL